VRERERVRRQYVVRCWRYEICCWLDTLFGLNSPYHILGGRAAVSHTRASRYGIQRYGLADLIADASFLARRHIGLEGLPILP
jgi:hypothetical protein